MKILFFSSGFWPRIGGIETEALLFIQGLQARGHQCTVVAQIDHVAHKESEIYNNITIKRFDFDGIIPRRDLKKLGPIKEYLEWIVKEFQPDIVHLNTCMGWSAFIFSLFRNLFTAPVVLTIHSPFTDERDGNPLLNKITSMADQIGCVSNWVLTKTAELIPSATQKMRLIYNGLPMPEIAPLPLPFSPPCFLLIGRLSSEKGFDTAIRAFSLLIKEGGNARLFIAGGGECHRMLEDLVSELQLIDQVQFIGELRRDEVHRLINQMTCMLVPSYFESFGLVALEAMQMERPVIASRIGGLQEVVVDGETGYLIAPRDPEALSKAMQHILDRPQEAIKMGVNGRKRAMENFTLDQNVTGYENLYKQLTQ